MDRRPVRNAKTAQTREDDAGRWLRFQMKAPAAEHPQKRGMYLTTDYCTGAQTSLAKRPGA